MTNSYATPANRTLHNQSMANHGKSRRLIEEARNGAPPPRPGLVCSSRSTKHVCILTVSRASKSERTNTPPRPIEHTGDQNWFKAPGSPERRAGPALLTLAAFTRSVIQFSGRNTFARGTFSTISDCKNLASSSSAWSCQTNLWVQVEIECYHSNVSDQSRGTKRSEAEN